VNSALFPVVQLVISPVFPLPSFPFHKTRKPRCVSQDIWCSAFFFLVAFPSSPQTSKKETPWEGEMCFVSNFCFVLLQPTAVSLHFLPCVTPRSLPSNGFTSKFRKASRFFFVSTPQKKGPMRHGGTPLSPAFPLLAAQVHWHWAVLPP